jgi:hypothetical protein
LTMPALGFSEFSRGCPDSFVLLAVDRVYCRRCGNDTVAPTLFLSAPVSK